jgi:hypothetical protein
MKPFGFDRSYGKCRVLRAGNGKKIRVAVFVKKRDRKDARREAVRLQPGPRYTLQLRFSG